MKLAVVQLNSSLDYQENLAFIRKSAAFVKEEGATHLFLPECFYSMSDGTKPTPHLVDGENEHYQNIRSIAVDFGLYLVGGSAATLHKGNVVNRAFNFAPDGTNLGTYDKMNLFSCDIEKKGDRKTIDEADIYTPGTEPLLIDAGGVKVGLGICFDLRYPEIGWKYAREGAQILTFSSAFTVPTGRAHWKTLLRARAIENQCFVVAAAQWGKHNERIITYGHSMVIDPWGDVLMDAAEGVGTHIVEIDLGKIEHIRKSVKVFK